MGATIVTTDEDHRTTPGNLVFTFPALAADDCVVIFVAVSSPGTPALVASGGGLTSWTHTIDSATGGHTFYGSDAAGGGTTCTVTITDASLVEAVGLAIVVRGVALALPQPDAPTYTPYTPAVPPAYARPPGNENSPQPQLGTMRDYDLVLGFWWTYSNAVAVGPANATRIKTGPSAGWTELQRWALNGSGDYTDIIAAVAYLDAGAAGAYSTVYTLNASPGWYAHAIGIKAAGPASALAGSFAGTGGTFGMLSAASNVVVPPAVIDQAERWLYAGVDCSTFAYLVSRSVGADDSPALRGTDQPWAGRRGAQYAPKLPASRIIPLDLYVFPLPSGGVPTIADRLQARANLDTLKAVFGRRKVEQPLIRVMPDGTGRVGMASVLTVHEMTPDALEGALFGLTVEFALSDPWMYGSLIVSGPTTIAASGQIVTVTNPGSEMSEQVVLELLGPFTNPKVTNQANGAVVQYIGTIASGRRLVLDVDAFTANLGGASVVGSVRHYGPAAYLPLEPGDNPLLITADSAGGSLTVSFDPPYA